MSYDRRTKPPKCLEKGTLGSLKAMTPIGRLGLTENNLLRLHG